MIEFVMFHFDSLHCGSNDQSSETILCGDDKTRLDWPDGVLLQAVVGLLSGVEAELTAFREVDSLGRLTAVVTLLSQLVRLEQVPLPVTSLIHLSVPISLYYSQ